MTSVKFTAKPLLLLWGLFPILSSFLTAGQVAIPIGPPERISPSPTAPDPILENLQTVMDNFFQPPWYPGGSPDYLSDIYYLSDNYIGNTIINNPIDVA